MKRGKMAQDWCPWKGARGEERLLYSGGGTRSSGGIGRDKGELSGDWKGMRLLVCRGQNGEGPVVHAAALHTPG